MDKRKPSQGFIAAREIARRHARLTDSERAALSAKAKGKLPPMTIEGHAISGKNALLLFQQNETVSIVAGFKQWQKRGRKVRKGQTALWIYAPQGEGEETTFRLVPVFDVTQTEASEVRP